MDKQILIDLVRGNPAYQQAITQIEQQLSTQPISDGDINSLIKFLEVIIDHPDKYSQLRAAAIIDNKIDQDTLPAEFNMQMILSLLVALYGVRDRMQGKKPPQAQQQMPPPQMPQQQMPPQPQMAHGGLAHAAQMVQAAGRGGDSVLAHINPREAAMLKNMGASGSVNPETGLREYGWSWKSLIKTVLPAAIGVLAPVVGNYLGSASGAGLGTWGKIAGTGLAAGALGAGAAKLTGGNVLTGGLQSGVLGALGAGLGSELGKSVGGMFGQENLSPIASSAIGGGLIGAGMNALTRQDILAGALQGTLGGAVAGAGQKFAGSNFAKDSPRLQQGLQAAAQTGGNMLTAGYEPGQAIASGGLAGLAAGLWNKNSPADQAVDQTAENKAATDTLGQPQTNQPAPASGKTDWGTIGLLGLGGLGVASVLGGDSSNTQQTLATSPKLTTQQQQYFNLPSTELDWNAIRQDAAKNNMDVSSYIAQNWDKVSTGKYQIATDPIVQTQNKAQGGLSKIAYLAQGAGSGRDDTIDARLSDGEYVIDAETVALLGDGSTKEGARRLDQMRSNLRKQKAKKLAKGAFSSPAKSPLSYMRLGAR